MKNIMRNKHFAVNAIALLLVIMAICSCGHPSVPTDARKENKMPTIYPDYTEVTIPSNLCPTNFMMDTPCDEVVARLTVGDKSYTYGSGNKVVIDEDEWTELRDAAKGKSISVEVFAQNGGQWTAYKPFNIYVAEEEIDPYISYRLIQPSYVAYEDISLSQRNLTNYEQMDFYNNHIQTEKQGMCINCHSYQNGRSDRMLFHVRQLHGGTIIVNDGTIEKVNLKTDSTISAGVYPAWHPQQNIIAFSTNNTSQAFHTKHHSKIEVFDTASDLILYDVKAHKVSIICNDSTELEVFPTWSPDGNTLYYCSAHFEHKRDSLPKMVESIMRHKEIKYSIYALPFDQKTRTFGERRMIYDAAGMDKSATLPRISPDGRYMAFAIGDYGCFHVWHQEADIMLLDLQTMTATTPKQINSNESESYPSFSSNGRWLMTASRRDDGNYTRPYIAYFSKDGKCHKAFEVPQQNPEFNRTFLRSYNRPEFMLDKVKVSVNQFNEVICKD